MFLSNSTSTPTSNYISSLDWCKEITSSIDLKLDEMEKEKRALKGEDESAGSQSNDNKKEVGDGIERLLWSKTPSLVVGAG